MQMIDTFYNRVINLLNIILLDLLIVYELCFDSFFSERNTSSIKLNKHLLLPKCNFVYASEYIHYIGKNKFIANGSR